MTVTRVCLALLIGSVIHFTAEPGAMAAGGSTKKEDTKKAGGSESKAKSNASPKKGRTEEEQVELQKKLLLKAIERKIPKKKTDEYFVIGIADVTYHKHVERTSPPEVVESNGELFEKKSTEFRFAQAGESFPVVDAKFQIVDSRQAAVDLAFNHMSKYVRPSSKPKPGKANADTSLPTGDWQFVGRFKEKADAQGAMTAAKKAYEAEPRWVVPKEKQDTDAPGKAKRRK